MLLLTATSDFNCSICGRAIDKDHEYMLDAEDLVPTYCLWCGTQKITDTINMNKIFPLSMIKKILRERRRQVQDMIDVVVDKL